MSLALFADMFPTDPLGASTAFNRTGVQQLIHMFGYRFCCNYSGQWRCSSQDCPTPCAEGVPWAGGDDRYEKNGMRATPLDEADSRQCGSNRCRNAARRG